MIGLVEVCIRLNHALGIRLVEESCVVHLPIVDSLDLSLVEPLNAFTVFPKAILQFVLLWHNVCAKSVLLSLEPVAFVATLVGPCVYSKAMFLIVLILTLIHAPIVPDIDAHSLHVVVKPLALILATIKP